MLQGDGGTIEPERKFATPGGGQYAGQRGRDKGRHVRRARWIEPLLVVAAIRLAQVGLLGIHAGAAVHAAVDLVSGNCDGRRLPLRTGVRGQSHLREKQAEERDERCEVAR